ncbi:MAG: hypothetical protein PQJ60_07545 [Spirochaetales bacterium]|nr:hypothetical protein [Spirochaetales bacterium]
MANNSTTEEKEEHVVSLSIDELLRGTNDKIIVYTDKNNIIELDEPELDFSE